VIYQVLLSPSLPLDASDFAQRGPCQRPAVAYEDQPPSLPPVVARGLREIRIYVAELRSQHHLPFPPVNGHSRRRQGEENILAPSWQTRLRRPTALIALRFEDICKVVFLQQVASILDSLGAYTRKIWLQAQPQQDGPLEQRRQAIIRQDYVVHRQAYWLQIQRLNNSLHEDMKTYFSAQQFVLETWKKLFRDCTETERREVNVQEVDVRELLDRQELLLCQQLRLVAHLCSQYKQIQQILFNLSRLDL
jgi:hypothetical protein